mmetsp:Transcript_13479/g.26683  ORF Transcript_13479/g.26683 Transcript_13479/m.26683 type:complete len:81 (-) Transcript_13479:678-920(-)
MWRRAGEAQRRENTAYVRSDTRRAYSHKERKVWKEMKNSSGYVTQRQTNECSGFMILTGLLSVFFPSPPPLPKQPTMLPQ